MAARENQGYLIAIILLVLLTVILAILTYFAFSQAGSASSNLEAKEALLQTANSQLTAYKGQAEVLKAYMGVPPFTVSEVETRVKEIEKSGYAEAMNETSAIVQKYESDMSRYIRATPEGVEKTYPGLADDMSSTLMMKHRDQVKLNNQVQVAEEEKADLIRQNKEQLDKKDEQLRAARNDLQTEKDLHAKTQKDLTAQLDNAKNANRDVNEKFAQARTDWTTKESQLTTTMNDAVAAKKVLEDRLAKYESKRYDMADGRIVQVAPDFDRVYVDMGSADNLQLRQSFAVFDHREQTFERGNEKAKIEITSIIGPHTAEARIIESNNVAPILTGDFAMTATWDRGYGVPVALAGFFDLDGDGKSDLDRLLAMISQNGGTVTAFHDEEGKVTGKVTEDTRYIVMGTEPTNVEQLQGMSRIEKDAKDFVVQRVPLREFMNMMGIRSQSKTLEGTGTINRANRFPDRAPPTRAESGNSAFGNNK